MKTLYRLFGIGVMVVSLQLTLSASGVSGCGSTGGETGGGGGGVSAGTGTGDAVQDALTTLDTLLMVASTSLNVSSSALILKDEAGKAAAVDQHVHCPSGAQASVTGDNTADGLFDIQISMNSCEGVTGTTAYAGSSTSDADSRDFTGGFTESVGGNGCTLSLTDLDYSFSVPLDTIVAPTSETVAGALTAACTETGGSSSVTCDFSGGVNAQSTSALAAACTCTGDGCGT